MLEEAARKCDQPVNIVGSSMGGLISLHLAALQPELVRSLYLCAPAVHFLKDRIDLVQHSPGENIPIPDDYLHSSGLVMGYLCLLISLRQKIMIHRKIISQRLFSKVYKLQISQFKASIENRSRRKLARRH